MNNDRLFAAYALILIAGVASVITASILAGFATLPTATTFVEHVGMSLLFRMAYKSFGGFDWFPRRGEAGEAADATRAMSRPGVTAGAVS